MALGVEAFLIFDMAVVHQLFRLHGILFSNYFEYAVLIINIAFATRSMLTRKWSFKDRLVRDGILIGFGVTLFLDVVLVDQFLKLHTVNYPSILTRG